MITDIQTSQIIHQHHLFSPLAPRQLEQLLAGAGRISLAPQEHLFHRQDPAKRFYLVLKGNLQLYITSAQGQLKVLEVVRPNHSFAEALIFNQEPFYPVSAQAVQACELVSFDAEAYLAILKQSPDACIAVMAAMSMRLHKDIQEIENLSLQNAENRLLMFLLRHSKPSGDNSGMLTLDVPKRTLASRLSIQPETFSRLIKKMNSEGMIEESRGLINIPDLSRLYESIQQLEPAACGRCPMAIKKAALKQAAAANKTPLNARTLADRIPASVG
ncbi:Crp/Fnr family transcriptional regulator [Shewanella litorisediminis]|uniref:Crp/Fnr family transcriptional regulator n=1 Tax=Shewanella litorisediminis TaxID=1173586 RepID=A0ABX7G0X3_9GAMM|nr:Crp/Fnr family transcriptional regulator [Shewanella litorisediminis]MCL2918897.1 Crp/Fnr family transcriptional regulator [Shewanella litorisediminis]QRH00970.1 Crp/Fnr family transcriptional regulator [Shewanella litorisediminis]